MKPTVSRELFFFFTSFVDILCTALDGFVSLIRGIEQASEKEKKKDMTVEIYSMPLKLNVEVCIWPYFYSGMKWKGMVIHEIFFHRYANFSNFVLLLIIKNWIHCIANLTGYQRL